MTSKNPYAPPENGQCPAGSQLYSLGQFYLDMPSTCKAKLKQLQPNPTSLSQCQTTLGKQAAVLRRAHCTNDDIVRYCEEMIDPYTKEQMRLLNNTVFCAPKCNFAARCPPTSDHSYTANCTSNDWFTNFEDNICYLTKPPTPEKQCYDYLLSHPSPCNLNTLFKSNYSQKDKSDQCVRCISNAPAWARYCSTDQLNKFCHRKAPNGEWDGNLTSPWETRCEGNGQWNILPYPTCFQLDQTAPDLNCYNQTTAAKCSTVMDPVTKKQGCDWGVNVEESCVPKNIDKPSDLLPCLKNLTSAKCTANPKCRWTSDMPGVGYTCFYQKT
jgi:hypothetical protein